MPIFESDNFTVSYDACDKKYVSELTYILNKEMERILHFFEPNGLSNEKKVKLYSNINEYKLHLNNYVKEYQEWMIADTFDGDINLLPLDECRKTEAHRNMTQEQYQKVIIHEFVHSCQQEINPDATGCEWFWEALATNLAGQYSYTVPVKCTKEQLTHDYMNLRDSYLISYTIGKYMLKNYCPKRILDYVKNPEQLRKETDNIISEVQNWVGEN